MLRTGPMTDQLSRPVSRLTVRAHLLAWLREHADLPVRFLIAPPGFGKTTALTAYTAGRPHLRLALHDRLTAHELRATIAHAVETAGPRPPEIVLDDAHLANGAVLEALERLLADVPAGVHVIVSAQRRDIFDIGALCARGRAAVCDQAALALDAADTGALLPWVEELYPAAEPARPDRPVMDVTLFGRFRAAVGGAPIVWARRRDQQIIKFLLLRPDGSATRAELADAFWPHTARPLAMQNLRTACSTIRRAIGNVVGIDNVDAYLIAGERLVVNRTTIVTDVDRFGWHVALAEAEDGAGALAATITHLRSAERLYGNGLFAGDISEPAFAAEAQRLESIYGRVLARLSGALIERGSPDTAREYAAKALKRGLFAAGASGAHVHLRFAAS